MMLAASGMLVFVPLDNWASLAGSLSLLAGLWGYLGSRILIVIKSGFPDLLYRDPLLRLFELNPSENEPTTRQQRIGSFFSFILHLSVLVVICHAAVYCVLSEAAGRLGAFDGVGFKDADSHPLHFLELFLDPLAFLYFSLVTFATVGYGEIHPGHHAALSQFAVMSEIAASFTLVALTIACVTLSFDVDPSSKSKGREIEEQQKKQ
jgi:hypothetical protein